MRSIYHSLSMSFTLLLLLSASAGLGQSISLTSIGVPYVQDFNTLSSATGTTNNTLSINGWYMNETGTGANGTYGVDNGSSFTGDVYSYGINSPGTNFADRALGTMHSGTFTPVIGAKFTNNTGFALTSLVIWYKGEQWRIGQQNVVDKLIFSYSTNATDVVTGTYTPVPALDLPSPISVGGAGNPVDGNQFTFKIINGTITGLNIPDGATFWIHWTDQANAGLNDALSVDEFSLTPMAACSAIETFETYLAGATTFANGGVTFTSQTTNYNVDELPPYGFHGSDKFFDNFTSNPNPCRFTAATPFRLKSLYVYPSDLPDGHDPQTSGVNITFTGKRSGAQKFAYTPAASTFAGATADDPANRGFTLVNFAVPGYQDIAIDELVVTLGGTTVYFAIDNMSFCAGACNTITVTNPTTTTGTSGTAFSQPFTQSGGSLPVTFTTASTLPTGLTLAANGTLSGTPTQTGTFPITVTVTDVNGCVQSSSVYSLVIACSTITITDPGVSSGTAGTAFSQTFTQSGGVGSITFTTSSTLPTGLTLATNGTLSGTPTKTGSFPITVKATDGNSCFGTGAPNGPLVGPYTLVIGCQTITVSDPVQTTAVGGQPFSQNFTQTSGIGAITFTTASTLPTGLTLNTNGTLSGTPTQSGTFPIVVKATDVNTCNGSGPTYNLLVTSALPIVVSEFNAIQKGSEVEVSWKISEENINKYEVERSADGRSFAKINFVNALGDGFRSYSSLDGQPLGGNNFYRLKIIDKNGGVKYSPVVKVNIGTKRDISVYPNPVDNFVITLSMSNVAKGNYQLSLYNKNGQLVYSSLIDHEGGSASRTVQLPSNLAKGNYGLVLSGDGVNYKHSLIVQ